MTKHEGVIEADCVMEGLPPLRPDRLQPLLEQCRSIKVYRKRKRSCKREIGKMDRFAAPRSRFILSPTDSWDRNNHAFGGFSAVLRPEPHIFFPGRSDFPEQDDELCADNPNICAVCPNLL